MASASASAARATVRARSSGICELQIDEVCLGLASNFSHRKAAGQGGEWSPSNGLDACGSGTTGCHGWVERHPEAARRLGHKLFRIDNPSSSPAYIHTDRGMGWFLLHEDGTVTDVTWEEENQ